MTDVKFNTALIVGAGAGLSASLARALAKDGIKVALAARTTGDLDALVKETGARAFTCDATKRGEVEKLFADLDASLGTPDIVVYNASFRTRGPFVELDPLDVESYPQSAPFAMGKFALRGLAQSMARELSPQGIHVAHVVIDGGIKSARRPDPADTPDSTLDPDAIAESYMHLIHQPRSAWAWEIELRPWVEKF